MPFFKSDHMEKKFECQFLFVLQAVSLGHCAPHSQYRGKMPLPHDSHREEGVASTRLSRSVLSSQPMGSSQASHASL